MAQGTKASDLVVLDLTNYEEGPSHIMPGSYLFEVQKGAKLSDNKGQIIWRVKVVDALPGFESEIGKMLMHRTNCTPDWISFTVDFLKAVNPAKYKPLVRGKKFNISLTADIGARFGGAVADNNYTDKKSGEPRTNSKITTLFSKDGFDRLKQSALSESSGLVGADDMDDEEDPELEDEAV